MCGIVGAASLRDVSTMLLEGLRRLEYRGYDSAGIALYSDTCRLQRYRVKGKVSDLAHALPSNQQGNMGIAHTRWATHGRPTEHNAHPHLSSNKVAVVHNGILENHVELRQELIGYGYNFSSDTDSEVIAHLVAYYLSRGARVLDAVRQSVARLIGSFGLGIVVDDDNPALIAVRHGSPIVIGLGFNENFFASDTLALQPMTQRFISMKDGDIAVLSAQEVKLFDSALSPVDRSEFSECVTQESHDKGVYRHYMQKEIHEQPAAVARTLGSWCVDVDHDTDPFLQQCIDHVQAIHIVACGTSYHAGMVAKYWIESIAGLACTIEVASEYRYRTTIIGAKTLLVVISQSGETADTLAALRYAKTLGYIGTLAICNVAQSTMVREADSVMLTQAGREIGVASTKALTTQLVVLLQLTVSLARQRLCEQQLETPILKELAALPAHIEAFLMLDSQIRTVAEQLVDKPSALFLGRGIHYPIALEGALKLKEISYIHAEAFPAGELKHGPLALIDKEMPVIAMVANNSLLAKMMSNLQEITARSGQLFLFSDPGILTTEFSPLTLPVSTTYTSPILHVIPLQLLAYHVAVLKGTDVDQPRNLAKSVTVE